ncbi:hypothetical protein DFH08DRAFT_929821 [Mycena albidolilacea]|uniref:Uncharacterized protein n=1 Tax=Mycena albidolilacea TaxID=1033008 RepID=A0AAD7ASZ1_9AGAR|nr:hypothetical protein DFH08DRAFT_929821 [Mycena albidolilacea]
MRNEIEIEIERLDSADCRVRGWFEGGVVEMSAGFRRVQPGPRGKTGKDVPTMCFATGSRGRMHRTYTKFVGRFAVEQAVLVYQLPDAAGVGLCEMKSGGGRGWKEKRGNVASGTDWYCEVEVEEVELRKLNRNDNTEPRAGGKTYADRDSELQLPAPGVFRNGFGGTHRREFVQRLSQRIRATAWGGRTEEERGSDARRRTWGFEIAVNRVAAKLVPTVLLLAIGPVDWITAPMLANHG